MAKGDPGYSPWRGLAETGVWKQGWSVGLKMGECLSRESPEKLTSMPSATVRPGLGAPGDCCGEDCWEEDGERLDSLSSSESLLITLLLPGLAQPVKNIASPSLPLEVAGDVEECSIGSCTPMGPGPLSSDGKGIEAASCRSEFFLFSED